MKRHLVADVDLAAKIAANNSHLMILRRFLKYGFLPLALIGIAYATWFYMPAPNAAPMPMTIDNTSIQNLQSRRVYFGHQSVGKNLLDGVEALKVAHPELAFLKTIEIQSADQITAPGIYHSKIGANRDIASKLTAFEEILLSGVAEKVDLAVMKFCYVDIGADSDVASIFKTYCDAMERIQSRFPQLAILHATVPLTVHGRDLKAKLKALVKGDPVNARRAEYNNLVRQHYGNDRIFDIAAAESTLPDGTRVTFRHQGTRCESVSPKFTEGAGHLNELGSKHIGAAFLRSLGHAPLAQAN